MHLWGKAATNLKIYEEPRRRVHKRGSITEKETENDGAKDRENARKRNKTGASRVLKSQTVRLNCCFSANKYWQGFLLALWLSKSLSAVSLSLLYFAASCSLFINEKRGPLTGDDCSGSPSSIGRFGRGAEGQTALSNVIRGCFNTRSILTHSESLKNANAGLCFRSGEMKDGETGEVMV